jgi:CheY-like chemotaxis protein/predicted transcriptional regulator
MAENIGSFSFDVTKRILCKLYRDGSTKKTTLATKTGLNYNVCLRYIKMLKVLGWLDVSTEVSITETGRHVMSRLMNQDSTDIENNQVPYPDPKSYREEIKSISDQRTVKSSNKVDEDTTNNLHIMIVDDEPDVLLTYESFLAFTGFNVNSFEDSYQALKAFASDPKLYDLIILDIRMENLNGLQLYQSMKAMNSSSKIIFASALDAAKELTTVLPDIGFGEIIKKPVDKENFVKTVKTALGI